jgi:glycosyltransferase involved in cell wall biosynthesis
MIHARGYLPSLMALAIRAVVPARFLFDMRGFWADERVDAGSWQRDSLTYRIVKVLERRFFASADAIVSLTHDGVRAFGALGVQPRSSVPVVVIPTCTNLQRFFPAPADPAEEHRLGLGGRVVFGAVGTMSGWYLRDAMLRFLAMLVDAVEGSRALVITREDHARLRADAARAGLADDALVLVRADFAAMPGLVRLIDVGVLFLRDASSKRASAATTLGELLASGVPVVVNRGGGDASELVARSRAGVVIPDTSDRSLEAGVESVRELLTDEGVRNRSRAAAERHFDLREGVHAYAALYARLLAPAR